MSVKIMQKQSSQVSVDEMMLREEIARAIESIPIEESVTNAIGMRMLAAEVARGENNMFEGSSLKHI